MPDFSTNEWAIMALVLVAGWLLGLMSRSGGSKWRRAYDEEREAHRTLRRDYDAHLKQHGSVATERVVERDPPLKSGAF